MNIEEFIAIIKEIDLSDSPGQIEHALNGKLKKHYKSIREGRSRAAIFCAELKAMREGDPSACGLQVIPYDNYFVLSNGFNIVFKRKFDAFDKLCEILLGPVPVLGGMELKSGITVQQVGNMLPKLKELRCISVDTTSTDIKRVFQPRVAFNGNRVNWTGSKRKLASFLWRATGRKPTPSLVKHYFITSTPFDSRDCPKDDKANPEIGKLFGS